MTTVSKATYRFNATPIKIPLLLLPEIEKPILKFMYYLKGHPINKTILKRTKVKAFPNFKTYYTKGTVTKAV